RGPVAILEADDVARLSASYAGGSLAGLAAQLPARFIVVAEGEQAEVALTAAAEREAAYLVVMDAQGAVVGLIGPGDIARTRKLRTMRPPLRGPGSANAAAVLPW
ncbi:MAG TPA: hypothetical protein VFP84_01520, partial [Kofleriaceae bacterium]|nr:hypothetical protein [Kofleriaceae bacterium]